SDVADLEPVDDAINATEEGRDLVAALAGQLQDLLGDGHALAEIKRGNEGQVTTAKGAGQQIVVANRPRRCHRLAAEELASVGHTRHRTLVGKLGEDLGSEPPFALR